MKAYIPVIKLLVEVLLILATIFGTLFMIEREEKDESTNSHNETE